MKRIEEQLKEKIKTKGLIDRKIEIMCNLLLVYHSLINRTHGITNETFNPKVPSI